MTQAPATPSLVERLRGYYSVVGDEAAAALEAQQARIAELEGLIDSIAEIPVTHEDLNYLHVNVRHSRGSLSREVRHDAVVAIKTYRDILEAVQALSSSQRQPVLSPKNDTEGPWAGWMEFNVNHQVRIRLTDAGRQILRDNYERLFAGSPLADEYRELASDADHWVPMQLWQVMQDFGPQISLGCIPPFETSIQIHRSDLRPPENSAADGASSRHTGQLRDEQNPSLNEESHG